MKREKARQEAAKTERLEAQRERNFKERQHRQWKKAQAWLLDRAEQIKVLQRNEEVRRGETARARPARLRGARGSPTTQLSLCVQNAIKHQASQEC